MLVTVMLVAFGCSKENLVPDETLAYGQKVKRTANLTGGINLGPNIGDPGPGLWDALMGAAPCAEFLLVGPTIINSSHDLTEDPMHTFRFFLGGQHLNNCLMTSLCDQGTFQGVTVSISCIGDNCEEDYDLYQGVSFLDLDLSVGEEVDLQNDCDLDIDGTYRLDFVTHWSNEAFFGNSCSGNVSGTVFYSMETGITGGLSDQIGFGTGGPGGSASAAFIDP